MGVHMKRKYRILSGLCACLLWLAGLFAALPVQVAATGEQETTFTSVNPAAAYCVDTAQLLYENRADEYFAPGVVTKLMALMVAYDLIEACDQPLSKEIAIQPAWVNGTYIAGDRSSPYIGLDGSDTCTLEYLFTTALVANANDSCAALVHYCAETLMSGTEADFLAKMNEKAEAIGLSNTTFSDTIGFGGRGSTTVADAVRIAAAFYRYNTLVEYSNQATFGSIRNKNYLKCGLVIKDYVLDDAIGLIAGQATDQGNYCVITACEKEGIAYVFVVMGASSEKIDDNERWFDSGNAYEDIRALIPYVLNSYGLLSLCKTDDMIAELRMGGGAEKDFLILVPSETVELMVSNPEGMPVEKQIVYDSEKVYESEFNGKTWMTTDAPVRQGDVLGSVTYVQNGRILATVDLVAKESIETDSLKTTFSKLREFLFDGPMGTIIKITLAVVGLWVLAAVAFLILRFVRWIRKGRQKGEDTGKLLGNQKKPTDKD